jgi:signal peptidase II
MRQRRFFFLTAITFLILDQCSKMLVVRFMNFGETIPIIKDFFHITYILNPGASFGILKDQIILFVLLTMAILTFIFWLVWQEQKVGTVQQLLLGMITGGAVGNLIDRVRQGMVIDFIDFRGIWPYIFNIADIGIILGGSLFAVIYLRQEKAKETHDE